MNLVAQISDGRVKRIDIVVWVEVREVSEVCVDDGLDVVGRHDARRAQQGRVRRSAPQLPETSNTRPVMVMTHRRVVIQSRVQIPTPLTWAPSP
jgi:hypothetical protein